FNCSARSICHRADLVTAATTFHTVVSAMDPIASMREKQNLLYPALATDCTVKLFGASKTKKNIFQRIGIHTDTVVVADQRNISSRLSHPEQNVFGLGIIGILNEFTNHGPAPITVFLLAFLEE